MKEMKSILLGLLVIVGMSVVAQNDKYQFELDLNQINSDLIQINLITPTIESDKIIYNMPKIVPGTYKIYDFGQYVMDFEAFDSAGRALSVNQLDKNRWEIDGAKALTKISYWVEDTWDAKVDELVFEPGGTNIAQGENVVLNNHGFFGYFDGMKHKSYEVNVTRPENFYGSTGLTTIKTVGNVDQFTTTNYMDLVDAPIMYNVPDTTSFMVGGAEILISVYSKNKAATAKELAIDIKEILELQKDYLGGTLPVEKYAFIIYLYEGQSGSGGSGALEHSYSSFYYLPEMSAERLSGFVVRVAAHEFFHIVTPLNIHSEEIGDFDFINPKMSKHLWMYEGVTEYFAGHVQVYGGMQTPEEYLKVIEEKLHGAARFKDDLAFTELSLGCLHEHEDQYGNVYQKGALIGLCLDILLREQSDGKVGTKDMMAMLSAEYGKDQSFADSKLFGKIEQLSSKEIGGFFEEYVEHGGELPLKQVFEKVGISFEKDVTIKEITLGGVSLGFNSETEHLFVSDISKINAFGKALGYKVNDEVIALNGVKVDMEKVQQQLDEYKNTTQVGDKVEITISRKNKGKVKEKKLKAKAIAIEKQKKFVIKFDENASEQEMNLRKAWLGQN
jgi:predicted metalloprotease with PDZ domain